MKYTMQQTCQRTGLSYDTLKFYCKEGLVPNVARDKNNRRIFDERNIAWIKGLSCLRDCGMSIAEMKEYLKLCLGGEETIPQRQVMLDVKLQELEQRIREIKSCINYIHRKQKFYEDVLSGKREYSSNLITTDK